jgi:hypothetical protein
MNAKGLPSQQMGPSAQGDPGLQPQACATGITDAARRQLDRYSNDEVGRRVLDVVAHKTGTGSSWQ